MYTLLYTCPGLCDPALLLHWRRVCVCSSSEEGCGFVSGTRGVCVWAVGARAADMRKSVTCLYLDKLKCNEPVTIYNSHV